MTDQSPSSRRYTPAEDAPLDVLKLRIVTAMTYPHGHPGVPGLPDGGGCPRCNAEHALAVLIERAK